MDAQFKKVYVEATVKISPEGDITPLSIKFESGKTYEIDRLIYRQRACATKVGGTGIRYTVMINGHQTHIFEDEGRWFTECMVRN